MNIENLEWQVQRMCTDINNYELIIEKEKKSSQCSQKRESWKWLVSYHGSIVASGSVNTEDEARMQAISNVPGQ